jgi:endonuclease YncB( thermonuclease family)
MPVTLIAGSYRITGASPDGDSIRFYPTDPQIWSRAGIAAKANAGGGVQLRLDAIDALETHYTPPHAPTPWRQPAALGEGAAEALLDLLGFTSVTRDDRGYVTSATPTETPGYMLTRFADKYGRPVAMAFPGTRNGGADDGGSVYLDVDELRRSVNYQLLTAGWVYPTFYSKLYIDLRADLAAAAV